MHATVSLHNGIHEVALLSARGTKGSELHDNEGDALMDDAPTENHIVQRGHADLPQ